MKKPTNGNFPVYRIYLSTERYHPHSPAPFEMHSDLTHTIINGHHMFVIRRVYSFLATTYVFILGRKNSWFSPSACIPFHFWFCAQNGIDHWIICAKKKRFICCTHTIALVSLDIYSDDVAVDYELYRFQTKRKSSHFDTTPRNSQTCVRRYSVFMYLFCSSDILLFCLSVLWNRTTPFHHHHLLFRPMYVWKHNK